MISFVNTSSSHQQSSPPFVNRGLWASRVDITLALILWTMAFIAAAMVLVVLVTLWNGAQPVIESAGLTALMAHSEWHPTEREYGLLPMIAGTFAVSLGALVIAAPVAAMCGLMLCYYLSPRMAGIFRCLLQLLAGIPSVVYGLWGLSVVVPFIAGIGGNGACLLAGGVILAVMILPTVAVIVETAMRQLPPSLYQGALALGAPRYRAMFQIVMPAISGKLVAASILGLARAIGETMAVLMVSGNAITMPDGPLASIRTLSANIAIEMAYAMELHRSALFASGLVLMVIVLGMLVIVDTLEGNGGSHAQP